MCVDSDDNELETLEIIHHFVEILDRYFGSVRLFVDLDGSPAFYFRVPILVLAPGN